MNTPLIETERLILRMFSESDVEAIFNIINDKEVNTYLPLFPFVIIEDARIYLQNNYLNSYKRQIGFKYAICLKSDDIPIGYLNLSDDDSFDWLRT